MMILGGIVAVLIGITLWFQKNNTWLQISASEGHNIAIKTDGTLWAWGMNEYGQLGLGDTISRTSPTQVNADRNWKQVVCGDSHTMAIKTDDTLWAWGNNNFGQLGLKDNIEYKALVKFIPVTIFSIEKDIRTENDPYISSPLQVGYDTDWQNVDCGFEHTIAIKTNGILWAWGRNSEGQLGLGSGDTPYLDSPAQVGTNTNWSAIAGGMYHTLAVKTDGTLWAWGYNYFGQLGLGDTITRTSPTRVNTDTNWKQVACGSIYTLALKTDGTLWAWGLNEHGRVGLGDTISRTSPTQVNADRNWNQISCDGSHTLALKTDGTLWGWAYEMNVENAPDHHLPTQIGTDTNWKQVACGGSHILAFRTDGTLWAWGRNGDGALGLGDTTDRNTPTQVGRKD